MIRLRNAVLALVLASACVDGPMWYEQATPASYAAFVDEVQPVLERHCANPSCHGLRTRPLEIYAVGQHRLDAEELHLEEPLREEELRLNFWRACGFLFEGGAPERCTLLSKPLAPRAGGSGHGGGVQFEDREEADYQTLLTWVRSTAEDAGGPP